MSTSVLIAAGLGAGYGLWGLEAASPLAIPLILWAVMVRAVVAFLVFNEGCEASAFYQKPHEGAYCSVIDPETAADACCHVVF